MNLRPGREKDVAGDSIADRLSARTPDATPWTYAGRLEVVELLLRDGLHGRQYCFAPRWVCFLLTYGEPEPATANNGADRGVGAAPCGRGAIVCS